MAPVEVEKTHRKRRRRRSHHRIPSEVERMEKASRHRGMDEVPMELARGLGDGPERS